MSANERPRNFHGPDNAEHELRKAYYATISLSVGGGNREPVVHLYKHAFDAHRKGDRLSAERWARTTKHLSRALTHEAMISYLEAHSAELPFLEGFQAGEYNLKETAETCEDLLNSVADHVPPGLEKMPVDMQRYLSIARKHLDRIKDENYRHELLRSERIMAAHEYGRVLECMALAYEAEAQHKKKAA